MVAMSINSDNGVSVNSDRCQIYLTKSNKMGIINNAAANLPKGGSSSAFFWPYATLIIPSGSSLTASLTNIPERILNA